MTQPQRSFQQPPTRHQQPPATLFLPQVLTVLHMLGMLFTLVAVSFVFAPNQDFEGELRLEPFLTLLPPVVVTALIVVLPALIPPFPPGDSSRPARRRFRNEVLLGNLLVGFAFLTSLALAFVTVAQSWQVLVSMGVMPVLLLVLVLPTRRRLRAAQKRYERAGAVTWLSEQYQ